MLEKYGSIYSKTILLHPGMSWSNVVLKLHCDASGNRYVSLSNDNQLLQSRPFDIRGWHTYWTTFDGDSLRLFIDEETSPVLSVKMQQANKLGKNAPYTVRMLSPSLENRVTGDLDFISWKLGSAITPQKFVTALPSTSS